MKLRSDKLPVDASVETNKAGQHRYRWINAKNGRIMIDEGFSRIIDLGAGGCFLEIDGLLYIVKYGGAPEGSSHRIWLDNAIKQKLIEVI